MGRKFSIFAILALLIFSSISSMFTTDARAASGQFASYTPEQQALSYLGVQAIAQCVNNLPGNIPYGQAGQFTTMFKSDQIGQRDPKIAAYFVINKYAGSSDGDKLHCDTYYSDWVQKVMSLWGYTSGQDFICNALKGSRYYDVEVDAGPDSCVGTSEANYTINTTSAVDTYYKAIESKVYGGGDVNELPIAAKYVLYRDVFAQACNAGSKDFADAGSQNDGYVFDVKYIDSAGKVVSKKIAARSTRDAKVWWHSVSATSDGVNTCQELAAGMSSSVDGYITSQQQYAQNHLPCDKKYTGLGADVLQTACNAGQTNGAAFCTTTYNSERATAENSACMYGAKLKTDAEQAAKVLAGDTSAGKSACQLQGVGWIVCPVMTFLATITDGAYSFLAADFLSVDTTLVSSPDITKTWESFRNIANVAFVIVFLIIIYSQITGAGITNYGIKRMLPRLAAAAILVNMSLIICQLAVDLSNVLGYGVNTFFSSIPVYSTSNGGGAGGTVIAGLSWVAVIATAIGGTVALLTAISGPTLLAAFLAVAMIALILIARKAVIVLLVIISPLAFVAYLLPNTEGLFKKWYKMFYTMLLLFPTIGVVFGASKLAAQVINSASNGNIVTQMSAMAVSALPFFVVPSMLKGALAATGALGAKMQGWGNKATSNVGSAVKNKSRLGGALQNAKQFREQRRAISYAKGRGQGLSGLIGKTMVGRGGKDYLQQASTRADSLEQEEFEKDVKAASVNFTAANHAEAITAAQTGLGAGGKKLSHAERVAAIQYVSKNGSMDEVSRISTKGLDLKTPGGANILAAATEAYRAKGLHTVAGSEVFGALRNGADQSDVHQLIRERIEKGSMTATDLAQSEASIKLVRDAVKDDALTVDGRANLDKAITEAKANENTRAVANSAAATSGVGGKPGYFDDMLAHPTKP